MSHLHVRLAEWQRLTPEVDGTLANRDLGTDQGIRDLVAELAAGGRLEVLELVRGLEFRATSYVGRVRLGDITVTIEPKLEGAPFLHLLRYAYGLRHLDLHEMTGYATKSRTFLDLLVLQLMAEAETLLRRGLHRDYRRTEESLASPRGRIDIGRLAREWGHTRATLPCVHYPRTEDHILNRTLLAGLLHSAVLTSDAEIRARGARLAASLRSRVSAEQLTPHLLQEARAAMDRRTKAYESILVVCELLLRGEGVALDERASQVQLPGFLFDMNLFFQRLVSRFLHENLEGHEVEDEARCRELFKYDPERNPQRRRAPVQRPDFLIRREGKVVAVLDAKYRDLWETALPREMLYQLSLYALGRTGTDRSAVILFPTLNPAAREQAVIIRDPLIGKPQATVSLRPVNLLKLERLVSERESASRRHKQLFSNELAFGSPIIQIATI